MTEGYFLRDRATGAMLHGPYPQLTFAFAHYVKGETVVVHRRADGQVNIVSY